MSEKLMKAAACIEKKKVKSFGTCIGRFTHSRKFQLKITSLDLLAPYAKNKVWLKKGSEQHFIYGKNILKASVQKLSENVDSNEGVIIYSNDELPIVILFIKFLNKCFEIIFRGLGSQQNLGMLLEPVHQLIWLLFGKQILENM